MRTINFNPPREIKKSFVYNGDYEYSKDDKYFEMQKVVFTEYGIVITYSLDWETNKGIARYTEFKTMLGDTLCSAETPECIKDIRQLKYMATHFIKTVFEKYF